MDRDRRKQDRPLKRLRQLQSRLETVMRDSKALRNAAESSEIHPPTSDRDRNRSDE